MRLRRFLGSLVAVGVSTLGACATEDDKSPGSWTPGKGDGAFDLIEAGAAPVGGSVDIALDHRVPAFRVESYGGMKLAIDLKGKNGADGYLIVEGPLASDGDRVAIGSGTVIAEDDDAGHGSNAKLDLSLTQPGVYRILAGTYGSLGEGAAAEGSLTLDIACTARCTRPGIDQKTFVRGLQQQSGGAFAEMAKAELAALVHSPAAAAALGAQLDAILADPQLTGLERFPTIPLAQVALLRPALGQIAADPPEPDKIVTGDLAVLLGECKPERTLPSALDARLPGVGYGHFPSRVLSPCQFSHADPLAQVLTSLAAQNGSQVTFRGKTIKTPHELFAALIESGHTVQVRNERMYANFLSATVGDNADLIWPVWIDTGIRLSSGESFTIPVGHSHHAWDISGPNVNTKITFYLGVSGAGFFGQTSQRPAWSGMTTQSDVTISGAGADAEYLLSTLDAAATYLRRTRIERTTVAAGMPADGYGFVGVCNDSNAILEAKTKNTVSAFPLLRAKSLDAAANLNDGLDATIKALPNDGDGIVDSRDALRRAVAMQPFVDGSPLMWDAALGAQIATARRDTM
ncbi:MAG: hypothetical protein H0T42_28905 [Deltaproteobacteria bacterium]|nr:hypothetical protein [Deltaproteobacteria bacterium]